ncbi:MAG: apolipoprotein N-acyltransferase [Candidatus Binatia bacterium]
MFRPRLVECAAVLASAFAFLLYEQLAWPWVVLGWVALVPWLAVLDRGRSLREALSAGLLMSVALVLIVFGWFATSIQAYTGIPWAAALLVLGLFAPVMEPQFITFALARYLARRRGAGFWRSTLVGACIYVGTEWSWPKLFAETLGHGLYPSILMRQAADVAGAPGLTFVLIIANECVLATIQAVASLRSPRSLEKGRGEGAPARQLRHALAPAVCVAALVSGLLAYGTWRCHQLRTGGHPAGDVTAGLVQADISQYGRLATELGTFEAVRRILDAHFALSNEALGHGAVDFLMWPETVYPTTFGSPKSEEGAAFDREIGGFVTSTGVPLVFGAYDAEGEDEFNAAVFLEPARDGRVTFDTYRKASLFPLTERVPAVLESDLVRGWLPWLGTWKPGKGSKVVSLALRDRTLLVAPLICYDDVDPNLVIAAVRRGAEMIVTLSNDVWFGFGPAAYGHLVIAAFRSIETRRPQLRVTNTGISAVISPTGEFVTTAGVHQRTALVATVTPERHAMTLMLAWGDWFGPTALTCGLLVLGALLVRPPARRGSRQLEITSYGRPG